MGVRIADIRSPFAGIVMSALKGHLQAARGLQFAGLSSPLC